MTLQPNDLQPTVIHCWSQPRSVSTSLMYSFSQHPLVGQVIDEPLYASHLHSNPHLVRAPNERTSVYASQPYYNDLDSTYAILSNPSPSPSKPLTFIKHMSKHFPLLSLLSPPTKSKDVANKILTQDKHIILLRDPLLTLQSWSTAVTSGSAGSTTLEELGLTDLVSLHSVLSGSGTTQWGGGNVVVIDSTRLCDEPERVLKAAMSKLGLPFSPSMLSWPSGPKPFDGSWSSQWYSSTHASTTFVPQTKKYSPLPHLLLPLYKTSLPLYTSLLTHAVPSLSFVNDLYPDPRNSSVLYYVGSSNSRGVLYPRDQPSMVPFDSGVQGGDGVWEGVRIYRGKIFKFERHLRRLFESAKALNFKNVHTKEQVVDAVFRTLAANGMRDGAHIRLTLTRGVKCTSSMNPNFNVYGTTLIVLAEWKGTEDRTTYDNTKGVKLVTAAGRRNGPDMLDSKIHHNNLLNNIMPKIQANNAGAADALMLDKDGFVSETNATNVFMVKDGKVITPWADSCLPGITRESILKICQEEGIESEERRVSLVEFYVADEVFTSGTMGELTPVYEIDGRTIGDGKGAGTVTKLLQEIYKSCPEREGWSTPIPEFK
mmetsp:Transcript_13310/g.27170  ORF Transcript_13310/g.27170 Transcript_13310/m.27170 type:complete len:598 (-) Transcript_13310:66-1859(-)